ncbi:uncharacterized protein LOC110105164 [Dendrobium catenatum]|uniref:uncharacterized protein LOC110105164 n=1 Tax=Dendrobium catenatum TaxID=906689 RepID=UPI0009F6FB79|nr:uncharacterized protein LOC110105164 [Dendrobium catenatum]
MGVRQEEDGTKGVLIKWKNLLEYKDMWEPYERMKHQFPDFHLEDNVIIWDGSIVRSVHSEPIQSAQGGPAPMVYKRRNSSASSHVSAKRENMVKGKEKSIPSLRRDHSWKYSVQVDISGGEKTYVYLKSNFCEKVVKGGVTRMKEHLSCSHKNVALCANVPDKVNHEIIAYMKKSTTAKHLQHEQFDERVKHGAYFGSESGKGSSYTIHNRGARGLMDQYMTNPGEDRGQAEMMPAASTKEGQRQNAIQFNVATSPAYFNMLRSVGLYERGLKVPSMYELRIWILKEELQNIERSIDEIKRTWIETGVTIMCDGWFDMKSRSLINILVNNPYGTVFLRSVEASDEVKNAAFIFNLLYGIIEEIGEQLVVQVVTDNVSAYKAAGQMLMEKRKHLYWTPCAAHCIDPWVLALMRKFSKKEIIRLQPLGYVITFVQCKSLSIPNASLFYRFATSYLTLQRLLDVRQPLKAMFTSTEWRRRFP